MKYIIWNHDTGEEEFADSMKDAIKGAKLLIEEVTNSESLHSSCTIYKAEKRVFGALAPIEYTVKEYK